MKTFLTSAGIKIVSRAIDNLFARIKARFLGPEHIKPGKSLTFSFTPNLTLESLFHAASHEEGVKPSPDVFKGLVKVTNTYIDAHKEKAKAKVIQGINSILHEANKKGAKIDVEEIVGKTLGSVFKDMQTGIKSVVEAETTIVRNTSSLDAIGRIGALTGTEDPNVFFITVKDQHRCKGKGSCTSLHLLEDGITPRVWKLSDVGGQYGTKDDTKPTISRHVDVS
jgi:hypothetical protein